VFRVTGISFTPINASIATHGKLRGLLSLGLLAFLNACGGGGDSAGAPMPGDQANDRVAITNNQATLDNRVTNLDEEIAIDGPPPPAAPLTGGPATALSAADSVRLVLVSEVEPPVVEGEVVQATSIALRFGNRAVVSYNMAGPLRLGALDFFWSIGSSRPRLTSSIAFSDTDINAVELDGLWAYAVGATNDPELPFPAVMERYRIRFTKLILADNGRLPLTSFAATSTTVADNVVYATSGNTGEVVGFDEDDLETLGAFPLNDARWVAWDEDGGRVVVAQGTPGQLSIFTAGEFPGGSMTLQNTFSFPGAGIPESKTTVEVAGGKAFIAAGDEGVQIMCLADGQIIGSLPRPDPAELGLDPAVVVTNAVTVDDDLMFISNGEAGVYVAENEEDDFTDDNCDPQPITLLGKLRFEDLESANHVAYKGDYLFVAAGLGGVKVLRVDDLDDDDDDDDNDDD